MAAKRFSAKLLTSGVFTEVMCAGPSSDATVNVVFTNQNPVDVRVFLAYTKNPTAPDPSEYIVFNQFVEPETSWMFKLIAVESGYKLAARANDNNVSVVAYGFEE